MNILIAATTFTCCGTNGAIRYIKTGFMAFSGHFATQFSLFICKYIYLFIFHSDSHVTVTQYNSNISTISIGETVNRKTIERQGNYSELIARPCFQSAVTFNTNLLADDLRNHYLSRQSPYWQGKPAYFGCIMEHSGRNVIENHR